MREYNAGRKSLHADARSYAHGRRPSGRTARRLGVNSMPVGLAVSGTALPLAVTRVLGPRPTLRRTTRPRNVRAAAEGPVEQLLAVALDAQEGRAGRVEAHGDAAPRRGPRRLDPAGARAPRGAPAARGPGGRGGARRSWAAPWPPSSSSGVSWVTVLVARARPWAGRWSWCPPAGRPRCCRCRSPPGWPARRRRRRARRARAGPAAAPGAGARDGPRAATRWPGSASSRSGIVATPARASARAARRRASAVGSGSPKAATSCSSVGRRSAGRPPRTPRAMRSATSRSRTETGSGSAMDVASAGRMAPLSVS